MQQRTKKFHVGEWILFFTGMCGGRAYCFCLFSEREREGGKRDEKEKHMIKVYCMKNTLNERKQENFKERPWKEKDLDFH